MKEEIKSSLRSLAKTVFWLMLLVIFTYTPLFVGLFSKDSQFICVYYNIQRENVALFVNIGLLCMVMIDYFSARTSLDGKMVFLLFTGIVAIFVVYVHSGIMYEHLGGKYNCIINNNYLSFISHIVLLIIIGYFKFLSLRKPKDDSSFVATKIQTK